METGGQIDIIYTDFEKAFDKVPHRRLLSKLVSYGVSLDLIKWIEMFLCYRSHKIRINGKLSACKEISSGIPQGSVLGPLLFVIYINDFPSVCDTGEMFLFADDAKLYKHVSGVSDSVALNECCQNLYDWSDKWIMKLNIDKCKVLTISRKDKIIIYKYCFRTKTMGDFELERVSNMKDLGVTIDCELTFKIHIHEKINKEYQMLGIINRNFRELDIVSFTLLYKSLVRCHLEYSNVVWSPYRSYLIDDIERVQK